MGGSVNNFRVWSETLGSVRIHFLPPIKFFSKKVTKKGSKNNEGKTFCKYSIRLEEKNWVLFDRRMGLKGSKRRQNLLPKRGKA